MQTHRKHYDMNINFCRSFPPWSSLYVSIWVRQYCPASPKATSQSQESANWHLKVGLRVNGCNIARYDQSICSCVFLPILPVNQRYGIALRRTRLVIQKCKEDKNINVQGCWIQNMFLMPRTETTVLKAMTFGTEWFLLREERTFEN